MNEIDYVGQAKEWAHELHRNQKRKEKDIPYITHPARVVELLEQVHADDDVRVAGWLHDTVEDQNVSIDKIRVHFGDRVAGIVADVTEPDKTLPWAVRKRQAVEHVPHMPHESLLVKSADVIANMEETLVDYRRMGDQMFDVFNAPKEAQREHKKLIVAAIAAAWPENPSSRVSSRFTRYLRNS